jgi:Protein of unknown function (DUF2510)
MAVVHLRCQTAPLTISAIIRARFSLDHGPETICAWGDNMFQMPPGQHVLRVWYTWVWQRSVAETVFFASEDRPTLIVYTTRMNIFARGKIELWDLPPRGAAPPQDAAVPQDAAAAPRPPAWHADPTRRHEQRWWDGQAWSGSVSDDGVITTDPV